MFRVIFLGLFIFFLIFAVKGMFVIHFYCLINVCVLNEYIFEIFISYKYPWLSN